MACKDRHHTWQTNPPGPGTVCVKCGAVWGGKGAAAAAPKNGVAHGDAGRAERFAAALAALRPADPAPGPGAPVLELGGAGELEDPPPATTRRPKGWQRSFARRGRRLFFAIVDAAIEAVGRDPAEPEDEDEEEVEEALAESLAAWFPDGVLSPGKNLALAAGFSAASVWAGSKKKPGSKPDRKSPVDVASTVTSSTPVAPEPPKPPAAYGRGALAMLDDPARSDG